jgi:Na+-driven multidrug efflux pump
VKEGFWFCVKISAAVLITVATVGIIFAPQLVGLFRDDPAVIAFGTRALRFNFATFWLQSWVVMSNMLMQSTGRTIPATFLAVARQGLFFIPMVLILPLLLDETGIQMAQSAADVLTFLCAVPIQIRVLKSFPSENRMQ